MKKIISTVAALGLVVGVAGTASALDFSMSGQYVIEGYMLNNADGNDNTMAYDAKSGGFDPYNDEAGTDSAWLHTFIIKPKLQVNDKISMFSELRFARYNVWGNQDDAADGQTIDVYTLYMEYMSPVGKIRAGRCIVPPWGGDFLSTYSHADRLMWWPSFVADPFELLVFTQKTTESDWYNNNDDADNDVYEIDLTYKTDNLLLLGGYDYYNYKGASDDNAPSNYDRAQHQLRAYGVGKIANFTIEGEWGWRFGDFTDYDTEIPGIGQVDQDVDTMALMLDGSGQFDKLDVGLMYFWAEGQDDDILTHDDADVTAAMQVLEDGLGDDFNPLYILTGDLTGMLNSDVFNADPNMTTSGVNAIVVHSDFQVSDQLSLHGALGYAWADTTDMVEAVYGSVDDEYGWEIDLGAKYKLLDNLTYEVRAAYFNTGDFFDDIATAAGQDSDDLYLLSHHLTMTF